MIRPFIVMISAVLLAACAREDDAKVVGDADAGRIALQKYECGVCHVIPGVRGARGQVGPSLAEYRRGPYLSGKHPKTPELVAAWIVDPPAMAATTAMPVVGVTPTEARDIVAYLYTVD